jgi:NADPH:quinone reductase-like Zn-dependent oxidoreductase
MILGCDAAGYDEDGQPVVVHAVIADPDTVGDETFDPRRTLLSEFHQGTFAEEVVVPGRNVLRRPLSISATDAACLSTSWLTAYRMLFTRSGLQAGAQFRAGAGGG